MPILRLDGDAKGAVKATGEVAKGMKDIGKEASDADRRIREGHRVLTESVKNFKREQAEAARQGKQMGEEAAKIIRENETGQERYNRKVAEISRLFVAGKLSVEQMDRALARYNADLNQTAPAQQAAFGPTALANAKNYFNGLFGPGAVVALGIQMLRAYGEETNNVALQLQGGRSGLGQLAQLAAVSKDPKATMARLVDESKEIYNSAATNSLDEAGKLVFTLESANITDPKQRKRIANMISHGVIPDANQFSASIAALRSAYPDLSPDKLTGMGIVAAIPSPGGAEQIISAAGKSGEQLSSLGWKPEFGLAATSILSRAYSGAGEGGTRLEQFMKQLEHHGYQNDPSLKGMDPFQTLERIHSLAGDDRSKLEKYVGNRMEAIQGYRTLYKNRNELRSLTDAAGGADGTIVDTAIELATNTPEIENARLDVASKNRRASSRFANANSLELVEAMFNQRSEGKGWLQTGLNDLDTWSAKYSSEGWRAHMLRDVEDPNVASQLTPDLLEAIRKHLASLDAKSKAAPAGTGRQEP